MRAEQAEGWLLAHPGRVRTGMKKQITVMSMKATICIWRCQFTPTFISFLLHLQSSFVPIYTFLLFLCCHFFLSLTTLVYHTGLPPVNEGVQKGIESVDKPSKMSLKCSVFQFYISLLSCDGWDGRSPRRY